MSGYQRPKIEAPTFRDQADAIIAYGQRWSQEPPTDAYSVTTHPERFRPLHAVADALIAYLSATHSVDVDEATDLLSTLVDRESPPVPPDSVERVIRLQPRDENCSPLVLIYTKFPGVRVEVGLRASFDFPTCGCDACDETWESSADEMERVVLAVAAGGFTETVSLSPSRNVSCGCLAGLPIGGGQTYGWSLQDPAGLFNRSSEGDASGVALEALKTMDRRLRKLECVTSNGAWKAWPK